ncbi:MAG: NifB/NifX family molybdenum-iron cluster-binding protein [Clostridiales bacterium]|nr:NifB/NifX family molybdenum-iron cluster-binding protein [Clostridiales bacterium]
MLKIAVATADATVYGAIPVLYRDATHLLIMDADTDEVLEIVDGSSRGPGERGVWLARQVVGFDCEALLCGGLEREPFAILAEENSVTRYDAADLNVLDAVNWMNNNALDLITDFLGGAGCPEADPANCERHHDHDGGG